MLGRYWSLQVHERNKFTMMGTLWQCVFLLVVANNAVILMAAMGNNCLATRTTVGDTVVMTFPISPDIPKSASPLYAYVKRENDTTDVVYCERKQSAPEIQCSVVNPNVQSRGIVDDSLTLVFPNVRLDMQGVYRLKVHFNNSWNTLDCELVVTDVVKAEKNTKDDPTTIVVAAVVSLVIVIVIIVALVYNRVRVKRFCDDKLQRGVRFEHQNSSHVSPQELEDPEKGAGEVILAEQLSQVDDAVESETDRSDGGREPLLAGQPDGEGEVETAGERVEKGTEPLLTAQSDEDSQADTTDERTDQPAEPSFTPTPVSDTRQPSSPEHPSDPVPSSDRSQPPAPVHSSDPVVSLVRDFPGCGAYVLRFKTVTGDGAEHVSTGKEHCLLADTEAGLLKLERVAGKLSHKADVQIDHMNQVLTLTDNGERKESSGDFKKPVVDILLKETNVVRFKVINTGLGAEELKRQVDVKSASADVACLHSKDNQKILLLSSDKRVIPKVEQFVEDWRKTLASAGEFVTSSRLRVSVFSADITKLFVDGIVNAVDESLSCSGGVSLAIQKAAGNTLMDELQQHLNDKGRAAVTEVVDTTGGGLMCKRVLHAVGPRWGDYTDKDKGLCEEHLCDTIHNCLLRASELGLTSIAIPAISSGSFGVPREVATRSYRAAVKRFDQRAAASSLKHIYFVDTNPDVMLALRDSFREIHTLGNQGENTVRVLLLGKVGVGKSALGNNLLRKPGTFLSKKSFKTVMKRVVHGISFLPEHDIELQVVDTPGLFVPTRSLDDLFKHTENEIIKGMSLLYPGPHVVLFVLGASRFTPNEEFIARQVQELFPGVLEYTILVFTHIHSDETLEELVDMAPAELMELIEDCGGRTAAIDNWSSPSDLEQQVDLLTTKIVNLYKANERRCYSNEVIQRCLQLRASYEHSDKSLREMKQEVLAENDRGNRQNVATTSDSCTMM